jgi:hypothetical protein
MLQQVTIRSNTPELLRPLLESAIRRELRTIQNGIQRTHQRLSAFEQQYHMDTTEFQRRFTADDLGETIEFIEWMGEIKTLQLLEQKQRALKGAEIA